jgi:hypothetical protein
VLGTGEEPGAWIELARVRRMAMLYACFPAWVAALSVLVGLEAVPQILLALSTVVCCTSTAFRVSSADAPAAWPAGAVRLHRAGRRPLRVVSLAPSMTEIMLELQADDLLVGVLDGGERPAALRDLPSVGRQGQLDMERLLSLRPDLLLLWPGSVPPAQRDQLKRLGIATFSAEPHDIDQLIEQIEAIAGRIGRAEQGHSYAKPCASGCSSCASSIGVTSPCRCFIKCGIGRCTPRWPAGQRRPGRVRGAQCVCRPQPAGAAGECGVGAAA